MGAAGATGIMFLVQQSNDIRSRLESIEDSRLPKIEATLNQGL